MIQRGHGTGFAFEAFAELLAGNLDGDYAVEPCVAGLVDFAHAAGAEGSEDFIGTETCAGGESHGVSIC